jgi:hypothetical protein
MKNFGFYIFALIFVLAVASCRQDTVEFIPIDTITIVESDTTWDDDLLSKSNLSTNFLPTLSIEKLVSQLSAEPKFDTCNAERGGTITVPDNVTVTIPASACVNVQNRPCTGKLDVEILVLRKKGDFIAYNLPTSSGGKQLISGGVISVRVRQNGQEVKLANNKTIKVRYLMTEPDNQMQLFEGKIDGRFNFDWVILPTTGQASSRPSVTPWADSSQRRGYDMVLDRFGLINCDKFAGDSTNFNNKFMVSLPETFTNLNTSVYVAFKEMNSVLSLVGNSKARAFIPSGRGLPIGRVVTVVVMGFVKEKFYFAKQEVTIQNSLGATGQTVRLTPTVIEKETLKETLKSL